MSSTQFPDQPPQRYQATRLDDNHALIVDNQTGDVWYFIDAPVGVSTRYVGRLKPGGKPGDLISVFRLF